MLYPSKKVLNVGKSGKPANSPDFGATVQLFYALCLERNSRDWQLFETAVTFMAGLVSDWNETKRKTSH